MISQHTVSSPVAFPNHQKYQAELNKKGDVFSFGMNLSGKDLDDKQLLDFLRPIGCCFSQAMVVDYIKIDGSFIQKIVESHNDSLFVKAIVDVARGMGVKTVAEFVENEETLKILREYGVDYAQGYYIGKPAPNISPENLIFL